MENQTVSAAATLILIRPAAETGFRVRRIQITQGGSATSTAIRAQWGRKAAAFPTTLTSATPGKLDEKDAASAIVGGTSGAAGTCGTLATSEGAGTFTALGEAGFNNLNGFEMVFSDTEAPTFRANSAEAFVLRFPAAPGTTTNWSALAIIEEL
jgi:hypothetical protein